MLQADNNGGVYDGRPIPRGSFESFNFFEDGAEAPPAYEARQAMPLVEVTGRID